MPLSSVIWPLLTSTQMQCHLMKIGSELLQDAFHTIYTATLAPQRDCHHSWCLSSRMTVVKNTIHPNRTRYVCCTQTGKYIGLLPPKSYKKNPRHLFSYQSKSHNNISLCFGVFINCQLEKLTQCWPGDSHKNQQMATTFLRTSCWQQTIHLRIHRNPAKTT